MPDHGADRTNGSSAAPASGGGVDVAAVRAWIRANAQPLTTTDPDAPLTDLEPLTALVGEATVVGLGRPAHGSHELSTLTHRIFRFLVEELGFRSLAVEESWTTGRAIDDHLLTGTGDLEALLAGAQPQYRTEEMRSVLSWMRARNERHPADPLRFVGLDVSGADAPGDMGVVERYMAQYLAWWHDRTGHKVAHWGGFTHTSVAEARRVSFPPAPPKTHRNAGSRLRERFGPAYASIALMFHQGTVRLGADAVAVAPTSPGFTERFLATAGPDTYALSLHAHRPGPVQDWLAAPATLRLIGPGYDPARDAGGSMSGGSLADWFDGIVHTRRSTPTRLLRPADAAP